MLNNNEVKEVALMQQKIATYESFIKTLYVMMKCKKWDINYLVSNNDMQKEMNYIWREIKAHRDAFE